MEIKLINMKIRNFKAVREFEFKPDGENANVYGQMGTGKSTLYDAFWFALFGKNSLGETKFQWKPKDENNEPIHHLETEIQLTLSVNGEDVSLSRMVSENWVRKTGSDTDTYEGDVTTCRINGVKKTVSDYKKYVDSLIDEETFKMLTNVYYFSENSKDKKGMNDKKRREILFELVGNLDDEAVINSKKELAPLRELLKGANIDDKREQLTEERSKTKSDIREWDIRIDEADRSLPSIDGLDKQKLEEEKKNNLEIQDQINERIAAIRNGGFVAGKRAELAAIDNELNQLRSNYIIKQNEAVSSLQSKKQLLISEEMEKKNEIKATEYLISDIEQDKRMTEKRLAEHTKEIENLRTRYSSIFEESMDPFDEHVLVCRSCNRAYEEEEQDAIKENYQTEVKAFNTNKAVRLEEINAKGKELTQKNDVLAEDVAEFENKINIAKEKMTELLKEIEELNASIALVDADIAEIKSAATPFEQTGEYINAMERKTAIQKEIDNEQESISQNNSELLNKLNEMKMELNQINDDLSKFSALDKAVARKEQLIQEQKEKSVHAGNIEKWLHLLDMFTRTKVSLLTDRINSEFEITKFKLFEQLQNGSLREVCEPLFKGLEFAGAISNGERVNVGIDIINTISRLKGVSVPIFIDNAESVTVWHTEPKTQAISLIATAGEEKLKIEQKNKEEVA